MKFNEKLIELRKKQGLSQEELGYKLNVTRQTVSKWELGQTTPEMDKLIEIGKLFNVSVDELINETEQESSQNAVIEDQTIENESGKENKVKLIIIGVLLVVLVCIIVKIVTGFSMKQKGEGILDRFFNLFDKIISQQQNVMDNAEGMFDDNEGILSGLQNTMENIFSKAEIEDFNRDFEIHEGTGMGASVINALDEIIKNNKKEDRKITVKYMETETQNEEEIKNIKRNIDRFSDYELFYDYDADGFINKATIENITEEEDNIHSDVQNLIGNMISKVEIEKFNN